VRVVEQRNPSDAQRRRQQVAVAVHPDIARGGAGQPRQFLDPVLTRRRRAVRVADRRIEKLRHGRLDELARLTAHAVRRTAYVVQHAGNGAGFRSC
jgi:hypothetical protein